MTKLIKKSKAAGQPPKAETIITVITYNEEKFTERAVKDVGECFPFDPTNAVTWINVDGLQRSDILDKLTSCYLVHHLVLEDIVNVNQRPKAEDFGDYIFIAAKMLSYDAAKDDIIEEQVSILLGAKFVITFQEDKAGDVFEAIRDRIRFAKGRVRRSGPDYLAYALLDAIVDNYFGVLEQIGEKVEAVEEALMADPSAQTMRDINKMKRNLIFLRKTVWPMREAIRTVQETDSPLIRKETLAYYRDIYDHVIQVIDTVEAFRDTVSGMLDIYLSSLSHRLNEVMKVLTVIATIFMPLTFIAGIYGMNFNTRASPLNMPELNWPFGYLWALGIMAAVAGGMVLYFKKRKWF